MLRLFMMKNKPLFLFAVLLLVIGIVVAQRSIIESQQWISYVTVKNGTSYLCWDTSCGWMRVSQVEEIRDLERNPGSVPAFVPIQIDKSDIQRRTKIMQFNAEGDDAYPIKSYVAGKEKLVFSLKSNANNEVLYDMYMYDFQTKELERLTQSSDWLIPISLSPEETHVLLATADSQNTNKLLTYLITDLSTKKTSGDMNISSFSWGEENAYLASEELGQNSQTPKFSCQRFTNIRNCTANARRYVFDDTLITMDSEVISFLWCGFVPMNGWEYILSSHIFSDKNMIAYIQYPKDDKDDLKLMQNYTLVNVVADGAVQKSINGVPYSVKAYEYKQYNKEKGQEYLYRRYVLQHAEFPELRVYFDLWEKEVILDVNVTQQDIQESARSFENMLKTAVLY